MTALQDLVLQSVEEVEEKPFSMAETFLQSETTESEATISVGEEALEALSTSRPKKAEVRQKVSLFAMYYTLNRAQAYCYTYMDSVQKAIINQREESLSLLFRLLDYTENPSKDSLEALREETRDLLFKARGRHLLADHAAGLEYIKEIWQDATVDFLSYITGVSKTAVSGWYKKNRRPQRAALSKISVVIEVLYLLQHEGGMDNEAARKWFINTQVGEKPRPLADFIGEAYYVSEHHLHPDIKAKLRQAKVQKSLGA